MASNRYCVDHDKRGQASCKKCKTKMTKGELRLGKLLPSPFSEKEDLLMKHWFHPRCFFETFVRAKATTRRVQTLDDLEGYEEMEADDKANINGLIREFDKGDKPKKPKMQSTLPASTKPSTSVKTADVSSTSEPASTKPSTQTTTQTTSTTTTSRSSDDEFRQYRKLCAQIADESAYTAKSACVRRFIHADSYTGDTHLLLKLLLPGDVRRVYNINSKSLIKVFSEILGADYQEMMTDLDQGDVAETIGKFFSESTRIKPLKKGDLTIQDVDAYLDELTNLTKQDEQERFFTKVARRCTVNDLKMIIRLVKHDLRINARAKHILDGLDENAYAAFQACRDLGNVVERVVEARRCQGSGAGAPGLTKQLSVKAALMTPVLPMLAEACKSAKDALAKCLNGMIAEIKYDGERIQVHKSGEKFDYFSRSLKPVTAHKVAHLKEFIPRAFPNADSLILDSEVLLVDTATSKPLPFGTLGVHKKQKFATANVCLFVFDCLHYNGQNLMQKPISERRAILKRSMTEIQHRVALSEQFAVATVDDLNALLTRVFTDGLEGLVIKDKGSIYEPGKRHWLKIKRDYLDQGRMADSADLVVLGAYYGTGNKGGMMSVFLMGVYDASSRKWCTVTRVGNGHDDSTLARIQRQLSVVKIGRDFGKLPAWISCNRSQVPDFVVADPTTAPVWEITGAEFSSSDQHTADGISIRFPRVTRIRDDKTPKEATDLARLKALFEKSREHTDIDVGGLRARATDSKTTTSPATATSPASSTTITASKASIDLAANSDATDSDDAAYDAETDIDDDDDVKDNLKLLKDAEDSSKKANAPNGSVEGAASYEPPAKKTRMNGSDAVKPMCRYGAKCYQKNRKHLEAFLHPQHPEGGILSNIFTDMRFKLDPTLSDVAKLRRYIIAFDGVVVDDGTDSTATHCVLAEDSSSQPNESLTLIRESDIWNSINAKMLKF